MFALIRKDFLACRLVFAIAFTAYVFYAATALNRPLGFYLINMTMTVVLCLIPLVMEEKYSTDILVCFLPPSRRTIVFERYLLAVVTLVVGVILQVGASAILGVRMKKSGFWTLCEPQAIITFCIVPIAFVAIFWPCTFRFGLARGSLVFVVLASFLALIVTGPLFALDFFLPSDGFVVTGEMMKHPEQMLIAYIDHVVETTGPVRFWGAVTLAVTTLVCTSILLSIRFFERRDM